MTAPVFHLAIPVDDLAKAEAFYGDLFGCERGRRSERWIDFNFFGHQLVVHLAPEECGFTSKSEVDGKKVPVKHFGVVLDPAEWEKLANLLKDAGTDFIIEPGIRFKGEAGEQGTFFLLDPAGNALEFKCFKDMDQLFAA
ncbi:VOC family protein [Hyphococcus flavus]|uniref:VOC family protein n=1 Tax=Hyphococcus flavus TaxID=1866326 RepID=A0AAE9Z9Z6_9PROT|nr:VOC family protein [Hyphococcus flavus]WDI30219.1 VOC family protein [Hyphococcus flavus]